MLATRSRRALHPVPATPTTSGGCDELGKQFVRGIMLHTGPRSFELGDRLWGPSDLRVLGNGGRRGLNAARARPVAMRGTGTNSPA
ncbi:MAG: hypothetical protein ACRDRG_17310 [Pseudonocardiaceae bacterium]